MDKQAISALLIKNHEAFISKIEGLSDDDFLKKPGTKWTAGQQLDHVLKSVVRTDLAYGLPLSTLEAKFGLSDGSSKSYDALVRQYLGVLEDNKDYVLPETFAPAKIGLDDRQKSLDELHKFAAKLSVKVNHFSEAELDTYIIPHPVMGKLTLREMFYFTIYHVQHHDKQILTNLELA